MMQKYEFPKMHWFLQIRSHMALQERMFIKVAESYSLWTLDLLLRICQETLRKGKFDKFDEPWPNRQINMYNATNISASVI